MAGETKRPWDRRLVTIPLAVVITAGLVFAIYRYQEYTLLTEAGRPLAGFVLKAPTGNLVVIVDSVSAGGGNGDMESASGVRLTALDASTGRQVALRVLDDVGGTCWPAAAGRIWCSEQPGGLSLLDGRSLASIASSEALVAKAGLGSPVRGEWRNEDDDVVVELPDGRGARVESATLAVNEADSHGIHGGTAPERPCKTSSTLKVDAEYLVFGEGPRHPLLRAALNYGALPVAPASAPSFLKQDMQPDFLLVADSSTLLVLSESSLDPKVATSLISRVDATPRQLWTAELGGSCQHAEVLGGTLLVTTVDTSRRARAIDLATGRVLWQFAF